MRLVAISDTHNRHRDLVIPQCDILIHSGDATGYGREDEVRGFAAWFNKQPAKVKIFVPGNHEKLFEQQLPASKLWFYEECPDGILLMDESVTIEGLNIYGSPRTPFFFDWAFNVERGHEIRKYWDAIPDSTHILVTHGQPYGINDETYRANGTPKERVGCHDLWERIKQLKELQVYIGGHLHGAYGQKHLDGVSYYNAAICDDMYYPSNEPIVIEV